MDVRQEEILEMNDHDLLLMALIQKKEELMLSEEKSINFLLELGLITKQDIRRMKLKKLNKL